MLLLEQGIVTLDLAQTLKFSGRFRIEEHIVIGSDYGHNDPSKEPEFVKNMRAREDVAPAVIEKILCDNPRRLYGVS